MKFVVDTNIVFSAIWNTNGRIANLLIRKTKLNFYSPAFLLIELSNHQDKLSKKLSLEPDRFLELKHLVTRQIRFIEEERISSQNWTKAQKLTEEIDLDDMAFVALALELNCPLWTGDKKLSNSLQEIKTFQTHELYDLINN